jgi:hypothetical protein
LKTSYHIREADRFPTDLFATLASAWAKKGKSRRFLRSASGRIPLRVRRQDHRLRPCCFGGLARLVRTAAGPGLKPGSARETFGEAVGDLIRDACWRSHGKQKQPLCPFGDAAQQKEEKDEPAEVHFPRHHQG